VRTRVSTKGQVVIPRAVREKLQLRPGDILDTRVQKNCIILVPAKVRARKPRIRRDPITGFPVLTVGHNAPPLTSKQVAEMLAEFP
jgi:AbrB family looped-hinge helix DNA binding protein